MYKQMIAKKLATFPYEVAILQYEAAKAVCEEHNFKIEATFFALKIEYYKKYILWKKGYNKENNTSIEFL